MQPRSRYFYCFFLLTVVLLISVACRQNTTTAASQKIATTSSTVATKNLHKPETRSKARTILPKVRTKVRTLKQRRKLPKQVKHVVANDLKHVSGKGVVKGVVKGGMRGVVRRPVLVRWYRPRYRERRFRAPRVKLKRVPYVVRVKAVPWNYGSRRIRRIALTFDACSWSWSRRSRYDKRITDILIRTKTPATLFVGGKWVLDHKRESRALLKVPFFEFANHTYLHGHLTRVSRARLERELRWTQEIIYTHLGVIPALYRPPFFESNRRVVRTAAKLGLRSILGDLPSGDPNPKFTKRVMTRGVLRDARNGSIVVMHMNGGGHHTAEALPGIIRGLKRKGFTLVKVSTILGVPAYQQRK